MSQCFLFWYLFRKLAVLVQWFFFICFYELQYLPQFSIKFQNQDQFQIWKKKYSILDIFFINLCVYLESMVT